MWYFLRVTFRDVEILMSQTDGQTMPVWHHMDRVPALSLLGYKKDQ